jgi:hypothetical protein
MSAPMYFWRGVVFRFIDAPYLADTTYILRTSDQDFFFNFWNELPNWQWNEEMYSLTMPKHKIN